MGQTSIGTGVDGMVLAGALASLGASMARAQEGPEARWIIDPSGRARVELIETDRGPRARIELAEHPGSLTEPVDRPVRREILLRAGGFDPGVSAPPEPGFELELPPPGELSILQFETQVLGPWRSGVEELGVVLHRYLPHQAFIAHVPADRRARVLELPYVRWIGPYRPSDRIDPRLAEAWSKGELPAAPRVLVELVDRSPGRGRSFVDRWTRNGGFAEVFRAGDALLEITVPRERLQHLAADDDVLSIGPWAPPELDLDLVRAIGGADFLESLRGYAGQDVAVEVMDQGMDPSHPDFSHHPPIIHGNPGGPSTFHGSSVYGILFGDGTGDPKARGLLPTGQGVFAGFSPFYGGGSNRYAHTAELVDPAGPYRAIGQTNSWGDPRNQAYDARSAQMDTILFDLDLVITQSQGNSGNPDSRPQAWAKNIVSVGGIRHQNTLSTSDDSWSFGASSGPAPDGRVKPDLVHFYDSVYAAGSSGGYGEFGGTSAATPIVMGHFGLLSQMWHEGLFGNPTGSDPFDSRPRAATARALLINTAFQWPFSGAGHDLTRTHQGWGRPDLRNLYHQRLRMLVVNETDALQNLQSKVYGVTVAPSTPELKATLVFRDPPGTTSAAQHRINDLSLELTSPSGVVYWGNHGLDVGNHSLPGGTENSIDPIENVFVLNPEAGAWQVRVVASELNLDGNLATPLVLDAVYGLVVSGLEPTRCDLPRPFCVGKATSLGQVPSIGHQGSASLGQGNLDLTIDQLVPMRAAMAFSSSAPNDAVFQGGVLCALPPLQRLGLRVSDAGGHAQWRIDLGQRVAGTSEYFQVWSRDPAQPDGTGIVLSNGLEVYYCQ